MGVADVITDALAYARLLSGEVEVPIDRYKVAYVTIMCFGVVTTGLSLALRFRNARLMRAHVLELGKQGQKASASEARQHAQQHKWELAQTHRTKVILSLTLLGVVAQGALPFRNAADGRACMAEVWRGCRFADVRHQRLPDLFEQRQ